MNRRKRTVQDQHIFHKVLIMTRIIPLENYTWEVKSVKLKLNFHFLHYFKTLNNLTLRISFVSHISLLNPQIN